MKKLITIFMCVLIAVQAWIHMVHYSNRQLEFYGNYEQKNFEAFMIPDMEEISYEDEMFRVLLDTASQTGTNIYRSSFVEGGRRNSYEIIKFMLLVRDSDYLNKYTVSAGHTLTIKDTQNPQETGYLTSKNEEADGRTGKIDSRMIGRDITVRPLAQMFSYYKAGGLYYAELQAGMSVSDFKKLLADKINRQFGTALTEEDLYATSLVCGVPLKDTTLETIIWFMLFLFVILFFSYSILNGSKRISVMRIMGNSAAAIFSRMFMVQYAVSGIFAVISVLTDYCMFSDLRSALNLLFQFLLTFTAITVLCGLIFIIFSARSSLLAGLKGRRDTKLIYRLNLLSQLAAIAVFLYAGQGMCAEIRQLVNLKSLYKNWDISREYAAFYPFYIGNDFTASERDEADKIISTDLYKKLNADGAIYVNAGDYEKNIVEMDVGHPQEEYTNRIVVNPNYLRMYDVLDTDGTPVRIEESRDSIILLVPEKYKKDEAAIRQWYLEEHRSAAEADSECYGVEVGEDSQYTADIIWISDGQRLFVWDVAVDTEDGCVGDCIVNVITEANSYISERSCVNGNGSTDPLKVRLKGDSRETYESLKPALEKMNLDDNLKSLVSVDEDIQRIMAECSNNLKNALLTAGTGAVMLIFLCAQNIMLNFELKKREYIIKKLSGQGKGKIYFKYILTQCLTVLFLVTGYTLFFSRDDILYGLSAALLLLLVQAVILGVCTGHMENKNLLNVIKGA